VESECVSSCFQLYSSTAAKSNRGSHSKNAKMESDRFSSVVFNFYLWGRNLGDESRGVSEAVSHREENAENDLRNDIERQSVEYSDCIESGSGRFRGAFEAEKIQVVRTYCKTR